MKVALEKVKGNEIKAIAGKLADAEAIIALKVSVLQLCFGTAGTASTVLELYWCQMPSSSPHLFRLEVPGFSPVSPLTTCSWKD